VNWWRFKIQIAEEGVTHPVLRLKELPATTQKNQRLVKFLFLSQLDFRELGKQFRYMMHDQITAAITKKLLTGISAIQNHAMHNHGY
jgi:hypothetical protein